MLLNVQIYKNIYYISVLFFFLICNRALIESEFFFWSFRLNKNMVRLLRYGTIFGPLKDRWRYLYKKDLYKRRIEAGPEPERFRSSLINW